MRRAIVFLEQQSWLGGAQRVLESALDSLAPECDGIVAFPGQGPFRSALEQRNVATMDLPIGNYRPGSKSTFEMIAFAWRSLFCGLKLAAAVRRRHIALIYINGPRLLPAGVLAGWLTGRPTIFHLHLILERRLELMMVRRLARRVSRILACSQAAATPLLDLDPRLSAKTQVLYNPVDRRRALMERTCSRESQAVGAVYDRPGSPITVGMVGRITEKKGQHLLLRAVGSLRPELRERVRLLFVGSEGPGCEEDRRYAEKLRSDSVRYGLSRQVVWAGYQSNPEACYASMDVLVHPSSSEALCLVILEALDRGIPVIAFRKGGIVEVVEDGFNGLLVSMENERELSRSLGLFLESCDVRERLRGGASRGLDRRFSMETFSPEIRTAVNQVCS
jgi:glycosyltransferase involved in cell wall biosynthesis